MASIQTPGHTGQTSPLSHHPHTSPQATNENNSGSGTPGGHGPAGQQGEDDGESDDANAGKSDEHAAPPLVAGTSAAFQTPTKQSSDQVAGLQLHSQNTKSSPVTAPSRVLRDSFMSDAVKQKMSELEASGWRPEEELSQNADDDDGDDDDDDDDYAGVDMISDSDVDDDDDDDGKDVRRRQRNSVFGSRPLSEDEETALARRLSLCTDASDDLDMAAFDEMDFDPAQVSSLGYWLDMEYKARNKHEACTNGSDTLVDASLAAGASARRVRFEDEVEISDSGSSDEDQYAETFPDLFGDVHQLTSNFRQIPDDDTHADHDDSDAGSYWDFEGEDMRIDLEMDDDNSSDSSSGSTSGYDSDDGETTDEEAPPPSAMTKVERPLSSASSATLSPSDSNVSAEHAKVSKAKILNRTSKRKASNKDESAPRMPTAGTFMLDPRRPILLVEGSGVSQRNVFFPAKIQSAADRRFWQRLKNSYQNRNSSPQMAVSIPGEEEMEPSAGDESSIDLNGPNPFFDVLGSLRADQIVGPPEAFMPFTSIDAAGYLGSDDSMQSGSEEEEGEDDFLALVDLGDVESDAAETHWKTAVTFPHLSNRPPSRLRGSGDDLLAHLDRNRSLVGSFRRNQHLAKHIGSLASHPNLRASTSEMNAMQMGRRAAANTPITPLRKKRIGKSVGSRTSPITSPASKTQSKRKGPVRTSFGGRR